MNAFVILLLMILCKANLGSATYAPQSPEPLSQDIDIENLMFLPPHDEIILHHSLPDDRSVVNSQGLDESIASGQTKRGRKPLSQHPRAVWMREYRQRKKAEGLENDQARQDRAAKRKQIEKEKRKSEEYVQNQRKKQNAKYKRLKEARGYGHSGELRAKEVRLKARQGIPMTSEEQARYTSLRESERKYNKKRRQKSVKQD